MKIKFIIISLVCPLLVESQFFSSLITGFLVRSEETYECEPNSYFKQIRRSSLIRSFRPDCHAVTVRGEGRNKYQAIDAHSRSGLFDADVIRVFRVNETSGKFLLNYYQSGKVIEHSSFAECHNDPITIDQDYLYDSSQCAQDYLHLNSKKAFLHISGLCHSICWGNVTLK